MDFEKGGGKRDALRTHTAVDSGGEILRQLALSIDHRLHGRLENRLQQGTVTHQIRGGQVSIFRDKTRSIACPPWVKRSILDEAHRRFAGDPRFHDIERADDRAAFLLGAVLSRQDPENLVGSTVSTEVAQVLCDATRYRWWTDAPKPFQVRMNKVRDRCTGAATTDDLLEKIHRRYPPA